MITVVGSWEMGWNTPIKEMDLWEFVNKEFNVNAFHMFPASGIFNNNVIESNTLDEVFAKLPNDHVRIFLDENGETDLVNFVHPVNAVYVLGKSGFSPIAGYKRPTDLSVKIATPTNSGLFWPHQALSIVLYDRFLKT